MRLTHLSLHNFRNYVRLDLDLLPGVTVLLGDNAQGKTNLLEAIFYLATTRSPHAGADREVVNWLATEQEPLPYARLVGRVRATAASQGAETERSAERSLEITLTREPVDGGRYHKQIRLNGVGRRAMDLLGQLNVVLFMPEDIALVYGAPVLRRHYLDVTLCQIDAHYCQALARYNQVLTQRNALLRDLRERGGDASQLTFWDEHLASYGTTLAMRRTQALGSLDGLACQVHDELTGSAEQLHLRYLPGTEVPGTQAPETVGAGLPALAGRPGTPAPTGAADLSKEAFLTRLQSLRQRDIAAGVTLAGPHRDEVRFLINQVDAGVYGSRGQQRTAALALKLAEVELMRQEVGDYPVLLLDDVLSELDAQRRQFLLQHLGDGGRQAILTACEDSVFPPGFLDGCHLWRIQLGRLVPVGKDVR